jgi:hypothetical protein
LHAVALGQQGQVFRGQVGHDGIKALPKVGAGNAGAGQHLLVNELQQSAVNMKAVDGGACGHGVNQKRFGNRSS